MWGFGWWVLHRLAQPYLAAAVDRRFIGVITRRDSARQYQRSRFSGETTLNDYGYIER